MKVVQNKPWFSHGLNEYHCICTNFSKFISKWDLRQHCTEAIHLGWKNYWHIFLAEFSSEEQLLCFRDTVKRLSNCLTTHMTVSPSLGKRGNAASPPRQYQKQHSHHCVLFFFFPAKSAVLTCWSHFRNFPYK